MFRLLIIVSLTVLTASPALAQSSDEAFQGFLDALETSRQLILSQTEEDGTDRAEGLRHIVRLVEMQNARATDDHDPAHPIILRCPTISCRVGFDNPDFSYINIPNISAEYSYRVFGKRGTVPYLSIQVFDNPFGGDVFMTSEDLVVEPDGSFEIILSATEPEGASNWMELKPGANFFVIRNGFYDWNNEVEASVQIEVIGGPMSGPVPVLTSEAFVADMAALSLRLQAIPSSIFDARDGWPLNDFVEPGPEAFGIPGAGVPTAISSPARYELATDEAMIIETPMPDVVHGGVQLGNLWVESIDPQSRQTSLNWFQSTPDSDGIIRYVLAHEDPRVPNWLDISGHPRGGIFFRWQSPSEENYPEKPTVRVVAFDEIRANLPADHPTVTPAERAEVLRQRYLAVNKRRNPTGQFDDVQASSSGGSSGCAVGGSTSEVTLAPLLGLMLLARRWRQRRS